jgi:hypothetical protein
MIFFLDLMKWLADFSIFLLMFLRRRSAWAELEADRKADPVLELWPEAIIFLGSIAAAWASSPPPSASSACGRDG